MVQIPTPRSFNRILGDMVDVFLSKLGLRKMKVGSPALSIFEAAAMSDLRGSQDIFDLLNSKDLDRAQGVALDRNGASEDILRQNESLASGLVTVGDSRISKIETRIYQGLPAPIIGSATVNVADGSELTPTGSVYLGRDTANYEGPLSYTSVTNNGSYWTINLGIGQNTTKFHNLGESVVLAQNGNRTIGAGTVTQTPQGNISDAVQFTTLYPATILDGEVEVEGVVVVAKKPGVIGNVPAGALNAFATAPFTGATVTNPAPYSNGRATESDLDYRERIKNIRSSRALATALAVKTAVVGITSSDESKRVASASVVKRQNYPTTLYIDDGTGYEERSEGVAIESLNDLAIGGEEFFQLSERPVAKAFVLTTVSAPYALTTGAKLSVNIGGVPYEHVFIEDDFRSISNASAYEIVASINANPALQFSARTAAAGTKIALFSKTDANEDIEVLVPATGTDANDTLLFPVSRVDTLRLYKNDRLLLKDGQLAIVKSELSSEWDAPAGTETLILSVDGTPAVTYSFEAQDFIDAETGFSVMGKNTPSAWASVFNYRIPGTSSVGDASAVTMTSNVGRVARASLAITGGTLVSKGMFAAQTVLGASNDYTLDRNTAQLRLEVPLAVDDRLAAGSVHTRGFVESAAIAPVDLAAIGNIYVAVDGDAEIVETGITGAALFDITKPSTGAWGAIYRIAAQTGTPFTNVAVGDWLLIWDAAAAWTLLQGMWRVCARAGAYVELQSSNAGAITATGVAFTDVGVQVVRYSGQMQQVAVPVGTNYTAEGFADVLNGLLRGSEALTFQTDRLRVRTNSYAADGDIAVVGADIEGAKLQIDADDAVVNRNSHLGSVETANSEIGTPDFTDLEVATSTAANQLDVTGTIGSDRVVVGLKDTSGARFGNNKNFWSPIDVAVAGAPSDITTRSSVSNLWLPEDRIYLASPYAIGPYDDLTVVADGDTATKRFTTALWRALRPVGGTYGATNTFKDIGDGTAPTSYLAASFGIDFNFDDFTIYMKARAKSHGATAAKSTLWRNKRFGRDGNGVRIAHTYPDAPNSAAAVDVVVAAGTNGDKVDVSIALPSDVQKVGYGVRNSSKLGYGYNSSIPTIPAITLCLGFTVSSATRAGTVVTLTLTLPSGLYAITDHSITAGATLWLASTDVVNFPSGLKTITSATATTVVYTEAGAATTVPNTGTVSYDSNGAALFSGATPSAIVVGDIVHIGDASSIRTEYRDMSVRITHVGAQFLQGYAEAETPFGFGDSTQTLAWATIADSTQLKFYALKAADCTATALAAAVNALDAKCPVTATVLGTGTGQILQSTRDELLLTTTAYYTLVDGINWARTTVNPASPVIDYQLTFKNSVDADLVSGADWANEEVRIAPLSVRGLVDWLAVPSLSGLFTSCSILASTEGKRVQLASLTAGAEGSVQVQGGSATRAVATVIGSATTTGTVTVATVRTADATGISGGMWCSLDNTLPLPKSGIVSATTALSSITAAGVITLSAGPALYSLATAATADVTVQVEKQGRFVAIIGGTGTLLEEGTWLYVKAPTTPGSDINSVNTGVFQVVRSVNGTLWIENPDAAEETAVKCDMHYFTPQSLMPGDTISINTDEWGTDNMGEWVVEHVGTGTTLFNSTTTFRVSIADKVPVVTGAVAALGDPEYKKVVITERAPGRLIKRVLAVVPNQDDATLVDVKFDTEDGYEQVTAAAGTVVTALDKLAFPLTISQGVDGYAFNTGLIGEASRVVYGDERDSATYPGVAAAGDQINIMGPLVKRVQVSLGIRVRLGVTTSAIASQVRSEVASVINKTGLGVSIAISDIVTAAARVNGVKAATVLAPTYGVGNDLISVQPFEKPLVLNADTDILVSFVGE